MKMTRRSILQALFGASVAAPVAAKAIISAPPPRALAFDGGTFLQGPIFYLPPFDELSAITLQNLRGDAIRDVFFAQNPLMLLLNKRERVLESGGKIAGSFCQFPGGKWERLAYGLQTPAHAPRLPA